MRGWEKAALREFSCVGRLGWWVTALSRGVLLVLPQAWLSVDGGNTFDLLADFHDDIIKNTYHSFYTSDITFVTQRGHVYMTKAGEELTLPAASTVREPGSEEAGESRPRSSANLEVESLLRALGF